MSIGKVLIVLLGWIVLTTSCKVQQTPAFTEVYADDFEIVNSNFWEIAEHTFENNQAHFNPRNVLPAEGQLILSVTPQRYKEKRFSAAELRSLQTFKYGRFVVRMKAAAQIGTVSAFFLYSTTSAATKEIDIEFTGKNTSVIHLNHWTGSSSNLKTIPLGFDAAQEFHEYAIIWLPNAIIWEVDGKEIFRTRHHIPKEPLNLMVNLWPSKPNDWAGVVDANSLPAQAVIDYVKVYSIY